MVEGEYKEVFSSTHLDTKKLGKLKLFIIEAKKMISEHDIEYEPITKNIDDILSIINGKIISDQKNILEDSSQNILNTDVQSTNKGLTIPNDDIWDQIPIEIRDLLYLSDEDPGEIQYNTIVVGTINISDNGSSGLATCDEPSTIYKKATISIPLDGEEVPELGYYPSYLRMYPIQKGKYLKWLKNIDLPIETGYIFVFYYGLERQLFQGNFDLAFSTIIRIRKNITNNSLLVYSRCALVYSSIIRQRYDRFL